MRVLHAADASDGGGAEKVFRQTVAVTAEAGCETLTVTARGTRTPISYVFSVVELVRFLRTVRRSDPQVVHLQNYYHRLSPSVLAAVWLARRRGWSGAVVFTAHDYHLAFPNSGFQHFVRGRPVDADPGRPRVRLGWRYDRRSWLHSTLKLLQHLLAYRWLRLHMQIDLVVTPSEFVAGVLRAAGVASAVSVVRNPVDRAFGQEADASGRRRDGARVLIYAGRLEPEKGLAEFVEAVDRVLADGRLGGRIELHVYGDGADAGRVRRAAAAAQRLGVRLLGQVTAEELARAMAGADAMVLPSRWLEVSPLTLVEGAASGLPLVVSAGGGAEETAELSKAGFAYRLDDDDALATALGGALDHGRANALIDPEAFAMETYRDGVLGAYETALRAVRSKRGGRHA